VALAVFGAIECPPYRPETTKLKISPGTITAKFREPKNAVECGEPARRGVDLQKNPKEKSKKHRHP